MSASVPRFTSFRPKPKPLAPPPPPPPEKPRDQESKHKHHTSSRHRVKTPPPRATQDRKPHANAQTSTSRACFSDRRGDADIIKYGTLNPYDVPTYRRCGYGHVLGLSGQKMDREHSTEKNICMTPLVRQRQTRWLTDRHAIKASKRALRLVKVAEASPFDQEAAFISLSATRKRKRVPDADCESDRNLAPELDYRGMAEKLDPDKADDPDTYYESDTEAASAHSETTKRNADLIRATRDNPHDLQAWLDLVQHQEPMMKLDRAVEELTTSDKQNLADVRIATYKEALRKVGDNEASQIELHTKLLSEAQAHWDSEKLAAKWQHVLSKHPRSVVLWFGYLDFAQSTFTKFKYEDCRLLVREALAALGTQSPSNHSATPEARLHLLARLTRMAQEAGYQELALAIWQAIFEFSLLTPPHLTADKLQQFEEFWESEAPRIGEPGSKGWRHTSIDDAAPPVCSITLASPGPSGRVWEGFQEREVEHMSKLRYPGRSTDDVAEEDPFHAIFFSDLKEYVTAVPTVPAELLVDAFLSFCGLPGLASTTPAEAWRADPFMRNRASYSNTTAEMDSGGLLYQDALSRYSQCPLASFQMTNHLLVQQPFSLDTSRLSPDFVRNLLKLLATNLPEHELISEYLLAFEYKHFPDEVAKTAKQLLKERPSSLRLYNMYGLMESHKGNSAKANQVFGAALNINTASADGLELLSSYIWQALLTGDTGEALWRIVRHEGQLPHVRTMQPDSHLLEKTRTALQVSLEDTLVKKDYASAVLNTALLALLTYLSRKCDAMAALEIHNNLISWFASHTLSSSAHAEVHAQALARLLTYHVTHTPIMKPALLRTALEPLIATFPDNTILLSTYAANEARFTIDDRVRGNMHRVLNTSSAASVVTWAFAVHHETLRGEMAGSTSHSIRALYKRATDLDASGVHCPALWRMYLLFEVQQLIKEQTLRPNRRPRRDNKKSKWESRVEEAENRVRDTFYQGLKMLPWCKDYIMLAFTDAREVFTEEELWRLYRVMMEKELRVHTELDEPDT
ncbi:hypothetical protein ST47_g231 [Ascochyta rabiei]|uniref:Uncharacterized protein n=2 Tax=Didymella rabiei TaxID=5454 RepID=A0A163MDR6_DIDRA|nr:hypothetical protein ST47_g231 [Ascochyta rabiei]